MKKVRLAVGVVVPAVGMLVMPAAAHAATLTTAGHRLHDHAAIPDANCLGGINSVSYSANGNFAETVNYNPTDCVLFEVGTLDKGQTGLTQRVRIWTATNPNKLLWSQKVGGFISNGRTYWSVSPDQDAPETCAALVANGTSTVKYGPVCIYL
jgi:hypothetical protein